jgi:hypothetical protein
VAAMEYWKLAMNLPFLFFVVSSIFPICLLHPYKQLMEIKKSLGKKKQ